MSSSMLTNTESFAFDVSSIIGSMITHNAANAKLFLRSLSRDIQDKFIGLLDNMKVSEPIIRELYLSMDRETDYIIRLTEEAEDPKTSEERMLELSKSEYTDVLCAVASSENCPPEFFEPISYNHRSDLSILEALSTNKNSDLWDGLTAEDIKKKFGIERTSLLDMGTIRTLYSNLLSNPAVVSIDLVLDACNHTDEDIKKEGMSRALSLLEYLNNNTSALDVIMEDSSKRERLARGYEL